jgi:UDP-N-acetylmuramoyl-tripeptide--D-alanyl-D-alanine ligase
LSLHEVLRATAGELVQMGSAKAFSSVLTDSRQARDGDLFIALKGQTHDGHAFVPGAVAKGVKGVIVDEAGPDLSWPVDLSVVRVRDTTYALGDLAALVRRKVSPAVVAITGSNGKTTSKEMIATILGRAWGPEKVLRTQGNENNLIGLPLTLLKLGGKERAAVVELGMNARGEIWRLTEVAAPEYGIVTNIAPAHLQGLGSVVGVAAAKAELFKRMGSKGIAIVNQEDPWVVRIAQEFLGKKVTYGHGGEVRARDIHLQGSHGAEFTLSLGGQQEKRIPFPLVGSHNIRNALGAAATAWVMGLDIATIAQALTEVRPVSMRMEITVNAHGVNIINDAYNANPASTITALQVLAHMEGGCKIAVLGDMWELGEAAPSAHYEVGEMAGSLRMDYLFLLGEHVSELARGAKATGVPAERIRRGHNHEEMATWLKEVWQPGDWVLLKGSRGMQMEKVLSFLSD